MRAYTFTYETVLGHNLYESFSHDDGYDYVAPKKFTYHFEWQYFVIFRNSAVSIILFDVRLCLYSDAHTWRKHKWRNGQIIFVVHDNLLRSNISKTNFNFESSLKTIFTVYRFNECVCVCICENSIIKTFIV